MVREREPRRPHADNEHALSGRLKRQRAAKIERIPACKQGIYLEAPWQSQYVLEYARLRLWDVDRVLLLIDAGLHAVVADAVPGGGDERVVDADHRQRRERQAVRAQLVKLGDFFLERAAGEDHAERRLLEGGGRAIGRFLFTHAR